MFGTIRHHQKWLWWFIIIVIIVTFVVFFTDSPRQGGGVREDYGSINGRPVKREERQAAEREAWLAFRFANRTWPTRSDQDLAFLVNNRLLIADKVRELGVHVGDEAVAEHIRRLFSDPQAGGFSQALYDGFVKRVLPEAGLKEADLVRFLRNELAIAHLGGLAGMSGRLITPRAAAAYFQRENELAVASAVFFNRSNHLAAVQSTPEAVTNYFTNNLSRYRVPERMRVSYAAWPATNYLKEASNVISQNLNFEKQLEELYQQRGTNSFTDANGKPLPPAEGRQKLREEVYQDVALRVARTNANEFAGALYKVANVTVSNFFALAAERKLEVKETAPFTEFDGPEELKAGGAFARAAFALDATNSLSSPVAGTDAIYLLAFKAHLPSEEPKFESVREKVAEDFRRERADDALDQQVTNFLHTVTNGLAQGRTFDVLCKEAKLVPVELPPFSLTSTELPGLEDRIDLMSLKRLSLSTTVGTVSPFVPTREGGMVLYVKARLPVPSEKVAAALPAYMEELRSQLQGRAFNEWFQREAERAGLAPGRVR